MICPNFNREEVFNGFNEIIEAFGGRAMTADEFKSSELRNLRTGLDYSAMEAAYKMYHRNNGNMPDLAPNGEKSILFLTLLDHFGGDRAKAIVAKSKVYSDEFLDWFGDWIEAQNIRINRGRSGLSHELEENALAEINQDFVALDRAIRKKSLELGHVPSKKEWSYEDLLTDAGLTLYISTEYYAIDKKEDVQFLLNSDYNEARMDLVDLQKKHPELNLQFETFKSVTDDGLRLIKDFLKQDLSQSIYDDLYLLRSVSKVVDENGEPLVVYHYTDNENLNEFSVDFDNYFAQTGGTKKAIFFTEDKVERGEEDNFLTQRKARKSVFLNIKDLKTYNGTKEDLHKKGTSYREVVNKSAEENDIDGGVHMSDFDDNKKTNQDIWIIHNPNQVKSATKNQGTFSRENDNIYYYKDNESEKSDIDEYLENQFKVVDVVDLFGEHISKLLLDGNVVSSKDILTDKVKRSSSARLNKLLDVLKNHDVPVRFEQLKNGKTFATIVDSEGNSVVVIDPTSVGKVSTMFFTNGLLHEVAHAVTIKVMQKPQNHHEARFSRNAQQLFDKLESIFDNQNILDYNDLYYFLNDKFEFVAEFLTNQDVRNLIYKTVIDEEKKNGGIFITFKNFINSLTRALINKNVFNTTSDNLKLLERQFLGYLFGNTQKIDGKKSNSELLKIVYKKLNNVTLNGEFAQIHKTALSEIVDRFELHPYKLFDKTQMNGVPDAKEVLRKMSLNIAELLAKRLAAVKFSNLPPDKILNIRREIEAQIQQFKSEQVNDFISISNFLTQVSPQLLEDSRKMRQIRDAGLSTTNSEYMYLRHDNFGVYKLILETITNNLTVPSIRTELLRQMEEDPSSKNSVLSDVDSMYKLAQNCYTIASEALDVMKNILINNMRETLSQISEDTNDQDLVEYLDYLEKIGFDTGWFIKHLGSASRAKDKGLNVLSYLINKAIAKTDIDTHKKSVKLIKLLENLSGNESALDLYEYDESGKTTQYLVRARNYGMFFRDYRNELARINEIISKQYNIDLDPENREAPDDNDEARKAWLLMKNEWLDKYADRRYTKEYYDLQSTLSSITRSHRDSIQVQIRELKKKAFDEKDKCYHFDRLTPQEYDILNGLYMQKKQLSSDYDLLGVEKQPGTIEYDIAKELQKFNEEIFDKKQILRNVKLWKELRDSVIKECGGIEEYEKGRSNDGFDWKTLDFWDSRNSKRILRQDENGETLLFKRIREEMTREMPVYENENHDNGEEYQKIEEKVRKLLSLFKDYNTGDVIPTKIPEGIKSEILRLEKRKKEIKKLSHNKTNAKKAAKKEYDAIFKKYARYQWTEFYKQMYKQALFEDIENPGYLLRFLARTGKFIRDENGDIKDFIPYKWYTKIVSKIDEFEDLIPGDGFIVADEDGTSSKWINPDFDESEGLAIVPKLYDKQGRPTKYNNKTSYNKVINNPRLRLLYYEILATMHEANQQYETKEFTDDYLLPSITGTLYKILKKQKNKWKAAANYAQENLGITEDDTQYGESVGDALKSVDGLERISSEMLGLSSNDLNKKTTVLRPDGRELGMMPHNYTRRLNDPSLLSEDIVGIVLEYYSKAKKFKYKQEIKDDCEAIVDMMENREYSTAASGRLSNTWQMARKFLDMNMYDMKMERMQATILGHKVNFSKIGSLIKMLTTLTNLGYNIAVAGTGVLTAWYSHLVLAITGQHYDLYTAHRAGIEVVWSILKNLGGARYVGNKFSKDRLMVIMEYYNVSDQGIRKRKALNRMRLHSSVLTVTDPFSMLSAGDFFIKSQIAVSTLMSYRYFNGEFVTQEDIRNIMWNSSEEDINKALDLWEDGVMLYSVIDQKDGEFYVDPKYHNAYYKIDDVVKNRILNYAALADGIATETQKAAITSSFLGSCILIHRQYLPLLLQERFGNTVWDDSMLQYVGGQFRIVARLLKALAYDQMKDKNKRNLSTLSKIAMFSAAGFSAGMLIPGVGTLGATLGAALFGMYKYSNSNTFSGILNSDQQNARDKILTNYNKFATKQVAAELLMYNLLIRPLILLLIRYSKDDDNKDKKLLQLITYIMTRFMWESYTPYRFDDMLNNVKTPSAATGTMDKAEDLVYQTYKTVMPQGSLLDTFMDDKPFSLLDTGEDILRGPYKGHSKLFRSFIKATPFHNPYEQWLDSRTKENYYINQVMKLDLDE